MTIKAVKTVTRSWTMVYDAETDGAFFGSISNSDPMPLAVIISDTLPADDDPAFYVHDGQTISISELRNEKLYARATDDSARVTLDDDVGHSIPHWMFTSRKEDIGRLQVDVAQTGFWDGREFRISYPLSIATTDTVALKVVAPVDFIIQEQTLTADDTGFLFRAFRSSQGDETGTYSTTVPIYSNNFMTGTPDYDPQLIITTGGGFTPTGGQTAVETIRLRTSNATAQQSTVGNRLTGERGLAGGTYYLLFTNIAGTGTATGVFNLVFEERPWLYE